MKVPKMTAFTLLLIFLISSSCGCWDLREINDIGFVIGVGFDKDVNSDKYIVTAQISKGRSGQQEKDSESILVLSSEGTTIFEAIRNMAKISSKRIMWAHNEVIIIGESLARDDITGVLDFLTHNMELRMRAWIAVSKGDAKQYLVQKAGMEGIPAMSINNLFRYSKINGQALPTNLIKIYADYLNSSNQLLIAGLILENNNHTGDNKNNTGDNTSNKNPELQTNTNQIQLLGAAVFKGRRMVGWLSPVETNGVAWMQNQVDDSIVVIPQPQTVSKKMTVEIKETKVDISPVISTGYPSFTLTVSAKGNIVEEDAPSDMDIEQYKQAAEKAAEALIKENIELALNKIQQEYRSDVLGFGNLIKIANFNNWKDIENDWEDIFPVVPVEVSVQVDILSSTLYHQPLKSPKKADAKND